MHQRR